MQQNKLYELGLHFTDGIGSVLIRHLVTHFGSAQKVFEANVKELTRVTGIGEKNARAVTAKEGLKLAEQELKLIEKQNVTAVFYTDPDYPKRLKGLYDAPVVLYMKGNVEVNEGQFVGIVGTRNMTDYGRDITEQIVGSLSDLGVTIVSGLAYGIDITAHRACLKHNLPTIGVMASGLNYIYPKIHEKTAKEIQATGGIVTENSMNTMSDSPARFVARNRIIAGLSDVTIVVESAERGGSLITAEFANNYNREVFAVPGNVGNASSAGCNALIKNHKAQIFTSVDDLLEVMRWQPEEVLEKQQSPQLSLYEHFTQEESQIVAFLKENPEVHIDDMAWHTQIHFAKLSSLLLNLEFQGFVRSLPGKRYKLI